MGTETHVNFKYVLKDLRRKKKVKWSGDEFVCGVLEVWLHFHSRACPLSTREQASSDMSHQHPVFSRTTPKRH